MVFLIVWDSKLKAQRMVIQHSVTSQMRETIQMRDQWKALELAARNTLNSAQEALTSSRINIDSAEKMRESALKLLDRVSEGAAYVIDVSTPEQEHEYQIGLAIDRSLPWLRIKLSCGQCFELCPGDYIPEQDVPCICGNPNHWFVKFIDQSFFEQ